MRSSPTSGSLPPRESVGDSRPLPLHSLACMCSPLSQSSKFLKNISKNSDQVIEFKEILKMRPKVIKSSVDYSIDHGRIMLSKKDKILQPLEIKV